MFTLLKGDCEHCGLTYHYSLLHAEFGDFSYAYCDLCGMLATIAYSSSFMVHLPPISTPHQVIDSAWEPFLRPCLCGGHFRRGAAPRCVHCHATLSAEHASGHIEKNFVSGGRGWRWQRNWSDNYCIALESPQHPGATRQVSEPFLQRQSPQTEAPALRKRWLWLFKSK